MSERGGLAWRMGGGEIKEAVRQLEKETHLVQNGVEHFKVLVDRVFQHLCKVKKREWRKGSGKRLVNLTLGRRSITMGCKARENSLTVHCLAAHHDPLEKRGEKV